MEGAVVVERSLVRLEVVLRLGEALAFAEGGEEGLPVLGRGIIPDVLSEEVRIRVGNDRALRREEEAIARLEGLDARDYSLEAIDGHIDPGYPDDGRTGVDGRAEGDDSRRLACDLVGRRLGHELLSRGEG